MHIEDIEEVGKKQGAEKRGAQYDAVEVEYPLAQGTPVEALSAVEVDAGQDSFVEVVMVEPVNLAVESSAKGVSLVYGAVKPLSLIGGKSNVSGSWMTCDAHTAEYLHYVWHQAPGACEFSGYQRLAAGMVTCGVVDGTVVIWTVDSETYSGTLAEDVNGVIHISDGR